MTSLGDVISGIKCLAKVLLQHQRSLLLLSGRLRTSFTEAWTVRSSKETYVIVSVMMLFYMIHAIMPVTDVYLCKRKKLHSILYVFHAILPSYPQYIPLNPPFIWDFYWFGCQRDPKGIFNGKGEINGNEITNCMYPMGLPSISIDFPLYISGKTAILYYTERRLYWDNSPY